MDNLKAILIICSATVLNEVRCAAQTEIIESSSPKEVTISLEEKMLPLITGRLIPDPYQITIGEDLSGKEHLCVSFFAHEIYSYNPYWAKTKSGSPSSKVSFLERISDYELTGKFDIKKSLVSKYIINGEICLEKP